jgi:hypothetical protein
MKVQMASSLSSAAALIRRFHPPSPLKLSSPLSATGMGEVPTCPGLTRDSSGSESSPYTNGQLRMNTASPLVKMACDAWVV